MLVPALNSPCPRLRRCSWLARAVAVAFLPAASGCADDAHRNPTPAEFGGVSLAGWTDANGQPVGTRWEAANGTIHLHPGEERAGPIVTRREFGDFEMEFEWKIAPGGNSGLKYRVRSYDGALLGCEYQILDDLGYDEPLDPVQMTGALYGLYAPAEDRTLAPAGSWNRAKIVVWNDRIEHWLNGKQVVSAAVDDADWRARVANSKFNDRNEFALNRRGRIMLTDHGSEAWYRNFRLRLRDDETGDETGDDRD